MDAPHVKRHGATRLRGGIARRAGVQPGSAGGTATGDTALIGRVDEMATAMAALRGETTGGVVVTGAAGVGKTRLAGDVMQLAAATGTAVVHAAATSASAVLPYGALVDVLPPDADAQASALDLFRSTASHLRTMSTRRGLILVVDNAELLDDASTTLLVHLARSGAARLLLTMRDDDRGLAAASAVTDAARCARLQLSPLDRAATADLVRATLGGQVEGSTQYDLYRLSGGNPLYVLELIAAGRAGNVLVRQADLWRAVAPLPVGRHLRWLVDRRLHRIDADVRPVVELVALAEPVEIALVTHIAGHAALARAEDAGVVSITEDGRRLRARLAHPLYGEVVRTAIGRLTSDRHRRGLADAISATGLRRRDDVLRLATWSVDSGVRPDAALLVSAARRAGGLFDPQLAVRLGSAAVTSGGGFEAELVVAEALAASGDAEAAERRLADLHHRVDARPDLRGRLVGVRAANLVAGFGRARQATELVEATRCTLPASEVADELAALSGMIALNRGEVHAAIDAVEPVLARAGGSQRVALRCLLVAIPAWAQAGRTARALEAGERMRSTLAATDLPAVLEGLLVGLCYARGAAGDIDGAEQLARDRYHEALRRGGTDVHSAWASALGHAALARGCVRPAIDRLSEAALLLRDDHTVFGVYALAWCLGGLAEAHALTGDRRAATATLRQAYGVTPEPCFVPPRELASIWVAAIDGPLAVAHDTAATVAARAERRGAATVEALAWHLLARLGAPQRAVGHLERLAARIEGCLAAAHHAHARALLDQDADELVSASRRYEDLALLLDAAESSAAAAGIYRRDGRQRSAQAAAQRAGALAARCEGARTPALLQSSRPQPLTPREREITTLAASGLTSRQIADRLVVSVRTVDNHLHRAYTKLGIGSRAQLADALHPRQGQES